VHSNFMYPIHLSCIAAIYFSSRSLWRNSPTRARTVLLLRFLGHTQGHATVGGTFCMRDRPVAQTSISQHTTLTRERPPCPQWDSNPQSQKASGRSPSPLTARPLVCCTFALLNMQITRHRNNRNVVDTHTQTRL
jgi:hypothetical protein